MTVATVIDADELAELVGDVFAGLFGADVERPRIATSSRNLHLVAWVTIEAEQRLRVLVACTERFVQTSAAALFGADVAGADEQRDLVGELANVIGGNLKSMLAGDTSLSLPQHGIWPMARTSEPLLHLPLIWNDHSLLVGVEYAPTANRKESP